MPTFEVTGRLLYRERGRNPHNRNAYGRIDLRQLGNMEKAVKKARSEGRVAPGDAREELHRLDAIRRFLVDADDRKAMVYFAPAEREMQVRPTTQEDTRKRRRAERQARKAGRPKKKRRRG
jgi:hypothetical protein